MPTEQLSLNLEDQVNPLDDTSKTHKIDSVTRNVRLTKAYELISKFKKVPDSRLDQEALIKIYYRRVNGCSSTIPVEEASDEQILRVTQRLFFNAYNLLSNVPIQEKRLIQKLFLLDRALRNRTNIDYIESLDERICIQLESFPDNSNLVREYGLIKNDHQ